MVLVYTIGNYIGFFAIMLILTILGIIFAKRKVGWFLYGIGSVLTLLSLIGTQKKYAIWGMTSALTNYWICFFGILIIGGLLIYLRRKK